MQNDPKSPTETTADTANVAVDEERAGVPLKELVPPSLVGADGTLPPPKAGMNKSEIYPRGMESLAKAVEANSVNSSRHAILLADLRNRFTHHPPKEGQPELYSDIRDMIGEVAQNIAHHTPMCREQSLAFTALEEACFWANAAIARHT